MNCQDVQGQLSDYVDRSLSGTGLALVQEHLAACSLCREEAELLGESIREIAALPLLDAPLGFTQRVMSHVRELERQPSFWQRFLLPLGGRIPAQATALVIVGFLGIYLLQTEQPQQQPTPPSETASADSTKQDSAPFTGEEPSAQKDSGVARFEGSLTQQAPRVAPSRQLFRSNPGEPIRQRLETPAASAPPAAVASVPAGSVSAPSPEPSVRATPIVSSTPVVTPPIPPDSDIPALRSTPATIEPFADLELVLRRHASQPASDSAGASHRELGQSVAPRPIERLMAAIPDHTRPQTIWINVPETQYEEFKQELFKLGIIEAESRVPMLREQASQADGQIRVKLTALPHGEAAAPNRPASR